VPCPQACYHRCHGSPPRRRGKGPDKEPRLNVGAEVYTEATNVTNYVKCSCIFGTLASARRVSGRVKEVIPGLEKDGRRKTDLRVAWVIKTQTVEKTLALRIVTADPPLLPPHLSFPTASNAAPPCPRRFRIGSCGTGVASPSHPRRHAPLQAREGLSPRLLRSPPRLLPPMACDLDGRGG